MKILIVVDMQHDFIDGSLGSLEAQSIIPAVHTKVREYEAMENSLIIYTQDTHYEDYLETAEGKKLPIPHCIYESKGWEIVPQVMTRQHNTFTISKFTFGEEQLGKIIDDFVRNFNDNKPIESVELCGVCTDICVISNALIAKAHWPQIPIMVDPSYCAGTTIARHDVAIEVMKSCQIDILD